MGQKKSYQWSSFAILEWPFLNGSLELFYPASRGYNSICNSIYNSIYNCYDGAQFCRSSSLTPLPCVISAPCWAHQIQRQAVAVSRCSRCRWEWGMPGIEKGQRIAEGGRPYRGGFQVWQFLVIENVNSRCAAAGNSFLLASQNLRMRVKQFELSIHPKNKQWDKQCPWIWMISSKILHNYIYSCTLVISGCFFFPVFPWLTFVKHMRP